jgi:hypothetical protein
MASAADVQAAQRVGRQLPPAPEIKDVPPDMKWIHKSQLEADPTYQRDANLTKIKSIARDWSWKALGALHVAQRSNGKYLVFEGNHRLLAAKRRPEVQELPCLVFPSKGVVEEAESFLTVNTNRRPLSSIDRFKAQVAVGRPEALLVQELLDSAGYTLSTSPAEGKRQTGAVGALVKSARIDAAVLREVWPLIVKMAEDGPIPGRLVQSVFYVQKRLKGTPNTLREAPWKDRLFKLGLKGLLEATAAAAALEKRSGETVFGRALVTALNRGVRQYKLVLPTKGGQDSEDDGEDDDEGGTPPAAASDPRPDDPSPADIEAAKAKLRAAHVEDRRVGPARHAIGRHPVRHPVRHAMQAGM